MKNAKTSLHLLLLLALAPAWAPDARADQETVDGLTWNFTVSDGGATLTYCALPQDTSGAIVIPSVLGGCPVTAIGDAAFFYCSGLTRVAIPDSVTSIGDRAFAGCSGLTRVTIPDTVTSIGVVAFHGCTGLTRVTIPDTVTNIASGAFFQCSGLRSLTIPDSVTSIDDDAFFQCSGLTNLTIPDSVTSIGDSVFFQCSGLRSLTIPDSVTSIGDNAFSQCSGLTSLTIGNSVAHIGDDAFELCIGLTSLSLPDSLETIGELAFHRCDSLETLYVPASLEGIRFAGSGCRVFYRRHESGWGYFVDNNQSTVCSGPTNGIVEIPSVLGGCPVVAIVEGAFRDASGITRVVIPDGVTTIGPSAFAGCVNLVEVAIPDSVVDLPLSAFDGCGRLRTTLFRPSGSPQTQTVSLTVTNVIVHYVTASVQPGAVTPPTNSTGIVNVITDVTAGHPIAIPQDWAARYPAFEATFGNDFSAALTADTGKRDGAGKPVYVWQDYVAGTDPTDPASLFSASVTYDAETGDLLISWSPELPPDEASKRLYSIYGRVNMTDPDWTLLATDQHWYPFDGSTPTYNFYLVTVEMK